MSVIHRVLIEKQDSPHFFEIFLVVVVTLDASMHNLSTMLMYAELLGVPLKKLDVRKSRYGPCESCSRVFGLLCILTS